MTLNTNQTEQKVYAENEWEEEGILSHPSPFFEIK